jgi:hypothetical protein
MKPTHNENHFYFTHSNVTADFMVDALEDLWPEGSKPGLILIQLQSMPTMDRKTVDDEVSS